MVNVGRGPGLKGFKDEYELKWKFGGIKDHVWEHSMMISSYRTTFVFCFLFISSVFVCIVCSRVVLWKSRGAGRSKIRALTSSSA